MLLAPAALFAKAVLKFVVDAEATYMPRCAAAALPLPTTMIDFGAAPYGLRNVRVMLHVEDVPSLPVVIVKDPAASVEPAATLADEPTPQLDGVPMVGAEV